MKSLILSFDVEEFDVPKIKEDLQYRISYDGTKKVLELLNKNNVKSTFFITANFAKRYKKLVKEIIKNHEAACHGLEHGDNYKKMDKDSALRRLKKAKDILEKITGKKVFGFRAPGFYFPDYSVIKKAGFTYDSSLHPTYGFSHYNHFLKKRLIFDTNGLKVIPLSVTPLIRLPLFWFLFRNLGLGYAKFSTKLCFKDPYIHLVFHPWEFVNLKKIKIPYLFKRNTGSKIYNKLDKYIKWARKKGYKDRTISGYLRHFYPV